MFSTIRVPLLLALMMMFATAFPTFQALANPASKRKPVKTSPDRRFQDFGDGTILDSTTKLMWMQQDYWQMKKKWVNWYTAQDFVQKMNNKKFSGYEDWRLPTPEEASKLYDRRRRNTDKDGDKIFIDRIFPKGPGWGTWTNSDRGGQAIVVSFKDEGGQAYQDKITGADAFLRLVRGPIP